jgi:tRNA pseudouridine32 synthase / 23S rRNA pseudouridine746 synthase
LPCVRLPCMKIKPERLVLWEDESLLVVNKPAGLPTLPDGYDPDFPHVKGVLEPDYGQLWIVHRLDKDTSGILLLARTADAHRALNKQFETRRVKKVYHALVKGVPDWKERQINLPLLADGDRNHRTLVEPRKGKPARTLLRVLESYRRYSLVEALPETGRTHQVRVHLASVGYPLVCDQLYGDGQEVYLSEVKTAYRPGKGEERPLLARLGLHARELHLLHPLSGEEVSYQAPHSKDFGAVLTQFRKL